MDFRYIYRYYILLFLIFGFFHGFFFLSVHDFSFFDTRLSLSKKKRRKFIKYLGKYQYENEIWYYLHSSNSALALSYLSAFSALSYS